MAIYAYCKVYVKDSNQDIGIDQIHQFCKEKKLVLDNIFIDRISGNDKEQPRYTVLKEDIIHAGDILIVDRVDQLGKSKKKTIDELCYFKNHGVRLMLLDVPATTNDFLDEDEPVRQKLIDAVLSATIDLYRKQLSDELEKRSKIQAAGIQRKKESGSWEDYGRPRVMSSEDFKKQYKKVVEGKITSPDLMNKLGMKRSTYFKYVKEYKDQNK